MECRQVDKLQVWIAPSRIEMGRRAAVEVAARIRRLLEQKSAITMIFAAAPSQNEFLSDLAQSDVDFTRIHAYHMDEYIGLSADAPQGFGNFLKRALFDRVPFASVNLIRGNAPDPQAECRRYGALLAANPPDIVCMGIGENGHIAFNDPGVADFDDPQTVKVVPLDETCRMQQVHDGCFPDLSHVPTHALTLTIPTLTRNAAIFCVVPAASKAAAVRRALDEPIGADCPASILRSCSDARLYLDSDSAALWESRHDQ
jgi:glucosamine-6-phosphate deaminase